MDSRYHVLMSLIIAVPSLILQQYRIGVASFLVGFLIDMDHEIDHFVIHKRFALNPVYLGRDLGKLRGKSHHQMYAPLHSVEFVMITLVVLPLPISLSYGVHILLDYWGNNVPFKFYSLVYRWKNQWHITF